MDASSSIFQLVHNYYFPKRDFSIKLYLKGNNSTTYLIVLEQGKKYLLRNYHLTGSDISLDQMLQHISAILQITSYLSSLLVKDGIAIPIPQAIASTKDNFLLTFDGKFYALLSYLEGTHYGGFLAQMKSLGASVGKLHAALALCPVVIDNPYDHYYDILSDHELQMAKKIFQQEISDESFALIVSQIRHSAEFMKSADYSSLPQQLLHRDLHDRNTLFGVDGTISFIDFDFVGRGEKAREVAFCAFRHALHHFPDVEKARKGISVFLEGYNSSNTLSLQEHHSLAFFIKDEALRRISYILRRAMISQEMTWFSDLSKHISHLTLADQLFNN